MNRDRWVVACLLLFSGPVIATEYPLPPADVDLVGSLQTVTVQGEETLLDIALREQVGQREIVIANADVDRWLPGQGAEVLLPTRYILPLAPRQGIVLNVPEMRLYYYPPARRGQPAAAPARGPSVTTHPVRYSCQGIGNRYVLRYTGRAAAGRRRRSDRWCSPAPATC